MTAAFIFRHILEIDLSYHFILCLWIQFLFYDINHVEYTSSDSYSFFWIMRHVGS